MPPVQTKAAKDGYHINTIEEKLVSDYIGIPITELDDLDCIDYWILRYDAFIYLYRQSEEGQEALYKAWTLSQTKPEKDKLRQRGMLRLV